jgi:hypothetical protein
VRANDWSTMVMSVAAAISKPRTNRNLARFHVPISQIRSTMGSTQASPRRRSRGIALCAVGLRQPPKEFVVDRIVGGRDGRRPSQKLPSTAIYCHFGAAKPLSPMQLFHSLLALEGMPASLGPGLRTATGAKRSLGGMLPSSAVCSMTGAVGSM